MGKNNNFIEINGKRYDATTGALVGHAAGPAHTTSSAHTKSQSTEAKPSAHKTSSSRTSIDGVVRTRPHHAKAHKPHSSKTLMRHAVKKPKRSFKRQIHAVGTSPHDGVVALADSRSSEVAGKKLHPTKHVAKSELISHFAPLPKSEIAVPTELPKITSPTANNKNNTSADVLEKALKNAHSHHQPAHHHAKKKTKHTKMSAAVLSLVAVGLMAFVGYQQAPSFKLQIASARAGFSGSLPTYQPSGFSMQKLSYGTGVIAMDFRSNSDNRSYSLTQKTSDWDSQALLESFVKPTTKNYQTVHTGGRTIYIYGNKVVTWVNGGIWYLLQTDSSLTSKQAIEIAKSI